MTKSEVRTLSVLKMKIQPEDVVWDIGAGTGSISVEAALNYPQASVCAIERNPEAAALIRQNMDAFSLTNITVTEGYAPQAFASLPAPNVAIIGGSGGNLAEIIDALWNYPEFRTVVINAVTINTAYQAIEYLHQKQALTEAFQMGINNITMIKDYQMFQAQNPIFIITGNKK